jgi:hypothetical protein
MYNGEIFEIDSTKTEIKLSLFPPKQFKEFRKIYYFFGFLEFSLLFYISINTLNIYIGVSSILVPFLTLALMLTHKGYLSLVNKAKNRFKLILKSKDVGE